MFAWNHKIWTCDLNSGSAKEKDDQLVAALQISRYWMFIVELYPIIHIKRISEESFLLIASAQLGHESHHVLVMGRRSSDCS